MGRITTRQMTDAVKKVVEGVPRFKQVQANESLAETISEVPLVQIYLERRENQIGNTDRTGFGGSRKLSNESPIRVKRTTIFVDVYARQRSNIGDDVAAVQDLADEVDEAFEQLDNKPYFGLEGIGAFKYRLERVTFDYNNVKYAGLRFTLELSTM